MFCLKFRLTLGSNGMAEGCFRERNPCSARSYGSQTAEVTKLLKMLHFACRVKEMFRRFCVARKKLALLFGLSHSCNVDNVICTFQTLGK